MREIEARVEQFCPYVVADDARVGSDERANGAGCCKRASRIKPSGYPAPFLAIQKERTQRCQEMPFVSWSNRLPHFVLHDLFYIAWFDPVTEPLLVHEGDKSRYKLARPILWPDVLWVFLRQPPSRFEQKAVVLLASRVG